MWGTTIAWAIEESDKKKTDMKAIPTVHGAGPNASTRSINPVDLRMVVCRLGRVLQALRLHPDLDAPMYHKGRMMLRDQPPASQVQPTRTQNAVSLRKHHAKERAESDPRSTVLT